MERKQGYHTPHTNKNDSHTKKNIHASNGTYRAPAYSTSEKDKEAAVNNFHSKSQKKNMGV